MAGVNLILLCTLSMLSGIESTSSDLRELLNDINTIDNVVGEVADVTSPDEKMTDSSRLQTRHTVPIHSNGVVTVISKAKPVEVSAQYCSPRTVLESLPGQTQTNFYWPSIVEVKRCMGECVFGLHPSVEECAVTKQAKKNVTVLELPGGEYKNVTIIDHVNCKCDCRIRAEHCHSNKERYVKDECTCKCVGDVSLCNSTYQKWDQNNCQCVCKYPSKTCSNSYEEWNLDSCECDCRKDIKKRCIRKGKLLDKSTCKCVCPPTTCPTGHVVNRTNCQCVAAGPVI